MTESHGELVERLRARTVKSPASDFNPFVSRTMPDPLCAEAADAISSLRDEVERLREFASNAGRAMRFVKLVASQRLSDAANAWYAGEFGEEGEPDFEGAYDSFIEQARCIMNDAARKALAQEAGEK